MAIAKMPVLCRMSDIKYTVVLMEKDDFNQMMESMEEHGIDEDIYGFISDNTLWIDGGKCSDTPHWSDEIIAETPEAYIMIIHGSPANVDRILDKYIAMENDWYHQHDHYDIWHTSVGHVAVC